MFAPAMDQLAVVASTAPLCTGPYAHQVIIASTSQVSPIRGPLQAAHFLCVSSQGADVMVCHPHIMVVDVSRSGATAGGGERGEHTLECKNGKHQGDITTVFGRRNIFTWRQHGHSSSDFQPLLCGWPCCASASDFQHPTTKWKSIQFIKKYIYKTHVLICPIFIWTQVAR